MKPDVSRRDFMTLMGLGLIASSAGAQAQAQARSGQRIFADVGS